MASALCMQILAACAEFPDPTDASQVYAPPLTFIVVRKRHATRMYPGNNSCPSDRDGNLLAGLPWAMLLPAVCWLAQCVGRHGHTRSEGKCMEIMIVHDSR